MFHRFSNDDLVRLEEFEREEDRPNYKKIILWSLAFLVLLITLYYANQKGLSLFLGSFLVWVQTLGVLGNIIFFFMFIIISFPFVLGGYIPLTLGAGAIYGIVQGTITVSIGSVTGACFTFWMSRVVVRKWYSKISKSFFVDDSKRMEKRFKHSKEFRYLNIMMQSDNQFLVTLLARLAPIPFGIQNSFFALTNVPFKTYFITTAVGLLPFQIIWTHLGTTLRNLGKISSGELTLSFWQKTSLVLQLVVLVALFGYFYVLSKKVKDKQIRQQLNDIDGSFEEVTVQS